VIDSDDTEAEEAKMVVDILEEGRRNPLPEDERNKLFNLIMTKIRERESSASSQIDGEGEVIGIKSNGEVERGSAASSQIDGEGEVIGIKSNGED
jgi:hypothetical protein